MSGIHGPSSLVPCAGIFLYKMYVLFAGLPSPPTNLSVLSLISVGDGGYNLKLEWSPSVNDGGGNVTSYQIFVDEVMKNSSTATMATIVLNSTGDLEYLVQVRAVNCVGYSTNVSQMISIGKEF